MGCSGAVCWTDRPRREQAGSGWEVRCWVKENGPALCWKSGLAEQGHQWEGQCCCVAQQPLGGTPCQGEVQDFLFLFS